ncbi:MAG: sugar ABC transporter substrate-binding protein [Sciscionella sp.]
MAEPTFLPLTVAASRTAADSCAVSATRARAIAVHTAANDADATAAACWLALLAACDAPVRLELPDRLRELCTAASVHTGRSWWYADGSTHRRRVEEARSRIEDAVRDGDGEEFAEAFVGYDQAVATALVCAPRTAREVTVPASRQPGHDVLTTPSR